MSPPPSPSPNVPLRHRARTLGTIINRNTDGFGTWVLSIVLTIMVPCLPIGIEWLRTSKVAPDSFLITAAVLSALYACSAENNMFRAFYVLTFLVSLMVDAFSSNISSSPVEAAAAEYAGTVLVAVVIAHATERLWWHVVWDRPFPDFLWRTTP
jgi:hypothetical protein